MKYLALVPTHLDGILLENEKSVVEAYADFRQLPYCAKLTNENITIDHNPDTANLSESILSPTFQNQNLQLGKGFHLHWSLPDGLTKGNSGGRSVDYPAVPNRWLVTRYRQGKTEKQWIIESDYLHPNGKDNLYHAVSFPIDSDRVRTLPIDVGIIESDEDQPYRYLGRQVPFFGWEEDTRAERLEKLTAIGYGEPSFAAFYPNCHSVFGCYDEDMQSRQDLQGCSYQVIGWYHSNQGIIDPLVLLLQQHKNKTATQWQALVKDTFGWCFNPDSKQIPNGIICYADLTIEITDQAQIANSKFNTPVTVAIGNTGTEALSAYLARRLRPDNPLPFEEQLEKLSLEAGLKGKHLDLGPRFQQARHEKCFKAEDGGAIWQIRPDPEKDQESIAQQVQLPASLTDQLSELNSKQSQLDNAVRALHHEQHLLFADWYKYMMCAYPPQGGRDDFPDIDVVRAYIESWSLPKIEHAKLEIDTAKNQLNHIHGELAKKIEVFNGSTIHSTLFSRALNQEQAINGELTLSGEAKWLDNKPVSKQCLVFNGRDVSLSYRANQEVRSLSMWINLASNNRVDAVLLSLGNKVMIAREMIAPEIVRVTINGQQPLVHGDLHWRHFPKDQWFHLYLEFNETVQVKQTLYFFSHNNTRLTQGKLLALRLFSAALTDDEIYIDQNYLKHRHYLLKKATGARFWQPTEPVILLEGEAIEPSKRHGEDGRLSADNTLACSIMPIEQLPLATVDLNEISREIERLKQQCISKPDCEKPIGFDRWTKQPWLPFLLEWAVEIFPLAEQGNIGLDRYQYDPEFLTHNYQLEEKEVKLKIKPNRRVTLSTAVYSGRTVMTPYAKKQLLRGVQQHFLSLKVEDAYRVLDERISEQDHQQYKIALQQWIDRKPKDAQPEAWLVQYRAWYLERPIFKNGIKTFKEIYPETDTGRLQDFSYALLCAYERANQDHFLSQALGGFNNALLMHHQTLQLPVADPLGFDDYRLFTQRVKQALGNNNNLAPEPLFDFLPIRSGVMRLTKLNLIDTFGQVKAIPIDQDIIKCETMTLPHTGIVHASPEDIWLSPRVMQAMRLQFRWRSAQKANQEFNNYPNNTPICGWLLANHLDQSLAIYDASGQLLGSIDQTARWRPVPGSNHSIDLLDISNDSLRLVVARLAIDPQVANISEVDSEAKRRYLQHFLSTLDRALARIAPESSSQHQEFALLMGRPVALVRSSLHFEIKGAAAIDHSWTAFRRDLGQHHRESAQFEQVKVPIRLGTIRQLDDALVGYWLEDQQSQLEADFYTPVEVPANQIPYDRYQIKNNQTDHPSVQLSLNGTTLHLTMLIDPRGEVQASCGILPTKRIDIPKDQYTQALKNIYLTFLTTPILTAQSEVALPLPQEEGYVWSWLSKDRFSWQEASQQGLVQKDHLATIFKGISIKEQNTFSQIPTDDLPEQQVTTEAEIIWNELLDKGWLHPQDDNNASIVPSDQRISSKLDPSVAKHLAKIQKWLDAGHIVPTHRELNFNTQQHILEGWLKLSPTK